MSAPFFAEAPGGEQLDEFDATLEQRIPVAPEVLPIAVGAVDRHRAKGRRKLHHGLDVDQRLLRFEARIAAAVEAFAKLGFRQPRMEVLEIPVQGDGAALLAVTSVHRWLL